MKMPISYRWITAVLATAILVITVLLVGRGGSETPRSANIVPTPREVVQKKTPSAMPTERPTPSDPPEEQASSAGRVEKWDLVVLGRIDACYVCQRGSPHVNYTRVLAGKIPNGHPKGTLALAEIARHILPEGGVPIYQSQQDEIVFLKRPVVNDKNKDKDMYIVVDVMKATSENLALFHDK